MTTSLTAYRSRVAIFIVLAVAMAGVTLTANRLYAAVSSTTGHVLLVAPPSSVAQSVVSRPNIWVFPEKSITLPTDVVANIKSDQSGHNHPGWYRRQQLLFASG